MNIKPLNSKVEFEVIARPEIALKKLAKAQIPVGSVKIDGAKVRFGVNQEYIQKVFAIFKHPCYNIVIRRKSAKMLFLNFIKLRFGLVVGAFLFIALLIISQSVVLKVKVTGNSPHLTEQVLNIASQCGVKQYTNCKDLDKPLLLSKVTSLNGVEFCSVTRQGWALVIDVHSQTEQVNRAKQSPLKAEKQGKIAKLVCISGTPQKAVGDSVLIGDILIANYEADISGNQAPCLAVGYADIEVEGNISLFYEEQTPENEKSAFSALALYSDSVTSKSLQVTPCDGGYYYKVKFTYLHTQRWNID